MVHGFFRASGIVMIYGLHHDFGRRKVGVSLECLDHFWRAEVGHFWRAPKLVKGIVGDPRGRVQEKGVPTARF